MLFEYEEGAKTMTETERDSIENSISTIASTPYGTAPFMRSMGIRGYPPANNSEIERNQYATEAIAQCETWEDRAEVSEITFTSDNDVKVVITDGED